VTAECWWWWAVFHHWQLLGAVPAAAAEAGGHGLADVTVCCAVSLGVTLRR